jgi:hypothetical protein
LGIKRLLRILLASHHKNEELLNADERKRKEGWTYPIEPCWGVKRMLAGIGGQGFQRMNPGPVKRLGQLG